jgi:hypothetical protein
MNRQVSTSVGQAVGAAKKMSSSYSQQTFDEALK